jgi:putative hydrolase of the HAD superfamily
VSPTRRPGAVRLPPLVLFDLDDTIFDHTLTCRAALGQLRKEGPELRGRPLDDTSREYGRLLDETHGDVMLGRRTSDDARAERFARLTGWAGHPVGPARAAELSSTYRQHYQRLRRPVPGATEAILRLVGRTQIGIVTNNTVEEQVEKLKFLHLNEAVSFLTTSEQVGAAKPDPAIFRAALEHAHCAPDNAVMVGDRWESDVTGARAAGIRALWFNRFESPRPDAASVPQFATYRPLLRFERLLSGPPRN